MVRKLQRVELNILCEPDTQGVWQVQVSADLSIGLDEYQDFQPKRKGIAVVLTPPQEISILNFVRTVVIPQAEASK